MKEKIRRHMEELFSEAPKTRKAIDLKEELTQNAIEKYEDLVGEGYREEDAFQNVIGSIGDVSELFEVLEEKNLLSLPEEDRRKKALLTAVSAGLYVFAGAVFLFFNIIASSVGWYGSFDFATLGLLLAVIICIAPTGMLVYANHMYPTFRKEKDSLVEDYKEARHSANRKKAIRNSITLLLWTVTLTLYFIISFAT
ncbi:MAG: permease prefix domain 1-containing protein [bacterium]|nr:permease prefix domain 1-containing protein [bacterium]